MYTSPTTTVAANKRGAPLPISKPFVAGMESIACASTASSLSKHGSPQPCTKPFQRVVRASGNSQTNVRGTRQAVTTHKRQNSEQLTQERHKSKACSTNRRHVAAHTSDDAARAVVVLLGPLDFLSPQPHRQERTGRANMAAIGAVRSATCPTMANCVFLGRFRILLFSKRMDSMPINCPIPHGGINTD